MRMTLVFPFIGLMMVLLITGCSDMGDPVSADGNGNGGGGISYTVSIQPIFDDHCVSCHASPANPNFGNLDLNSYQALMDSVGPNAPVIIAFEPDSSYLVQRIEGTVPPQMPLAGTPLSTAQIDTIRQWIDEGALHN